jgi:hypothetical protein
MRTILEVVGGLLIVGGVALFNIPAALIVAGVFVILFSLAVA